MKKLKNWIKSNHDVYRSKYDIIYIEKVSWFMLLPDFIIFYDFDRDRFEAIGLGLLFWQIRIGRKEE